MTRIFLTRPVPDAGIKLLKKERGVCLEVAPTDRALPRKQLLKSIKGYDIIWTLLHDRVDAEFFEAAGPQLKMIANYAVGFDNIDLAEAKRRGIVVANCPADEVSESVAEHAIMLMLGLARRVVETDTYTRGGKYHGWGPNAFLGTDVFGKTVGIIGGGRIGGMVARRLKDGFGVKILYHNPKRDPDFEKTYDAQYRSKLQLLKQSDFVTLHVPLVASTRHLISTKELSTMKPTAFLVNTSRGPVVDELALTKALEKKQIAGAGLDVFECEPLIDCDPSDTHALRKLRNVILTPHTGSASIEARQAMSRESAKNIIAFLHNKPIPHQV